MTQQTKITEHIQTNDGDSGNNSDDNSNHNQDIHAEDPITHPPEAITFKITGKWAHFKRIDGNVVKPTYYIPPRTTIAGLLAAILGIKRDQYYDLFAKGSSAIAVEPMASLRTVNMPMNTLTTSSSGLKKVNPHGNNPTLIFTDSSANRQQHNYEILVEPEYRVYVWVDDDEKFDRLESMISSGKSHYTPSLGLSEHLASVEYEDTYDVEPLNESGSATIHSAVPDGPERMEIIPGTMYRTERSPGYMSLTTGATGIKRRMTDEFIDYAYSTDDSGVTVTDASDAVKVGGQNIIFR